MEQIVDLEVVKSRRKFVSIDPSGNFDEGKGITGYAYFNENSLINFGDVKSESYKNQMLYWKAILNLLESQDFVVCESYKLQPSKSMAQSWSKLETPQLIGVIKMACYDLNIPIIFQDPSCKIRFSDDVLIKLGLFERRNKLYYYKDKKTNDHMRDAIRHGLYYLKYNKGEFK